MLTLQQFTDRPNNHSRSLGSLELILFSACNYRCHRPLVVVHPGDSAHRRTCKLPVTTPPPDKIVPTRESTSAADIEYSTLSYSTLSE